MAWIVPVCVIFYIYITKKEKTLIEKFTQSSLLPDIAPFYDAHEKKLRAGINILVVILMLFALARPQWGFYWKESKYEGGDIMIAVDTSKSMLATDMMPDRLSFVKDELTRFVKRLKGDRVGLIAFSGEAFLQCPLTADYGGFLLALNDLSMDTIPRGGTSIASAIEEARRSYKGSITNNKVLIIITDGENTEGDIVKAVNEVIKDKITVSCIGVGTPEGKNILVLDKENRKTYLRDQNNKIVISKLNENALKNIAKKTNGIYILATSKDFGLEKIYDLQLEGLEVKGTGETKTKAYREQFQLPLQIVFLILLYEFIIRNRKGKERSKRISNEKK